MTVLEAQNLTKTYVERGDRFDAGAYQNTGDKGVIGLSAHCRLFHEGIHPIPN